MDRYDTLVVGGGFGGALAARALERRHPRTTILLVAPESFLLFSPLLPEAASGTIEPRHAVAPLRSLLHRTTVAVGRVVDLDPVARTATIAAPGGAERSVAFRTAVVAAGSTPVALPIPGLAEQAVGFKTLADAIWLRNRVLAQLDAADATPDLDERRRLLTTVFVGGGYAGVEALAELEDLVRSALPAYPSLRPDDLRWVLVEASDRLLPGLHPRLGRDVAHELARRGVEVHLGTRMVDCTDGVVRLEGRTGATVPSGTIVWTAGQRPTTSGATAALPTDERGGVVVDRTLQVVGHPGVFAVGDVATVPDRGGGTAPATAQHAVRQARVAAANVAATLEGRALRVYRYRTRGTAVTLGHGRGVAQVGPLLLRGPLAWWAGRTYHLLMMPGLGRRARIVSDWTLALLFRRDIAQLGSLGHPARLAPAAGQPTLSAGPAPKETVSP